MNPRNVGEALLLRLKLLGVDYLFANPGSEFVSIIRGLAELPAHLMPEPVLAPHEFLAMSMAYGAYLSSGRPQAVMTHANVGAANAVIGLIAAARMNIPVLFLAGKTSASERQTPGHRDKLIHWAQEAKDQGAMYREYVKIDIEVRDESSLNDALDRAYAIAMSEPRGPVALSLTRDVLVSENVFAAPDIQVRTLTTCPPESANFLAPLRQAQRPLLITNRLGAHPELVPQLVQCAERHGLGIVTPDDFYMSFPSTHAQHLGFKHGAALSEADLVIVLDTEVPWYPVSAGPSATATVLHAGPDPLTESIPLRSHRGNGFLRMASSEFVRALNAQSPATELVAARLQWCAKHKRPAIKPTETLTAASVSGVLAEFLNSNTLLINELGLSPEHLNCHHPGTYFRSGSASPLGWGVGCALGLALKHPDKITIVSVGDGVFFISPVLGALMLSAQRGLPYIMLVLNNGGMRSIAHATREFYPAVPTELPLTQSFQDVRIEQCAQFAGGWGARVTCATELRSALAEAIHFAQEKRRPAIIEAII